VNRKPIDMTALREGRANLARLAAEHPELTSPEAQERLAAYLSESDERLTPEGARQTIVDMPVAERHTVNIRLDPALVKALDAAAEVAPVLSRHAICRAALHIGLAAIVADPVQLLRLPAEAPSKPAEMPAKPAKKRSKRPSM
jgi:hypothetical protein